MELGGKVIKPKNKNSKKIPINIEKKDPLKEFADIKVFDVEVKVDKKTNKKRLKKAKSLSSLPGKNVEASADKKNEENEDSKETVSHEKPLSDLEIEKMEEATVVLASETIRPADLMELYGENMVVGENDVIIDVPDKEVEEAPKENKQEPRKVEVRRKDKGTKTTVEKEMEDDSER